MIQVPRLSSAIVAIAITALVLIPFLNSANGQSEAASRDSSRIIPQIGSVVPGDLKFQDESGHDIRLGDLIHGKPVILLPIYYKCPMLCGLELKGLLRCLRAMSLTVGRDFDVIAFSFDPREKPHLASQKKIQTLRDYGRAEAESGWHFLTGPEESSRHLCDAIGFQTAYDKRSGQYAHSACILIINPDGRISQYFYGVDFVPRELNLGLVEASNGRIGTITDQVQLLCFMYDPATGRYGFAVLRTLQLACLLTVLALCVWIGRSFWLEMHRQTPRSAARGVP